PVLLVAQLRRMQVRYAITSRRLTIETGLLSRRLHQARLGRVQNVASDQTVAQRMVGIGTVQFDTAGEAEFDFCFRGVSDPRAIVRTVDHALHELRGADRFRAPSLSRPRRASGYAEGQP
ncbi:MAG: PH domain-containing protein, partial [Actinomycetota bacterium]|nr:PH domain-containing protein [Actinomycetota bacterium]